MDCRVQLQPSHLQPSSAARTLQQNIHKLFSTLYNPTACQNPPPDRQIAATACKTASKSLQLSSLEIIKFGRRALPGSIESSPSVTIDHSENSFFRQVHTISRKWQRPLQSVIASRRFSQTRAAENSSGWQEGTRGHGNPPSASPSSVVSWFALSSFPMSFSSCWTHKLAHSFPLVARALCEIRYSDSHLCV